MSPITRNVIGLGGFVGFWLIVDYALSRLPYGHAIDIIDSFAPGPLIIYWLLALLTGWVANRYGFASVQRPILRLLLRWLLVACATVVYAFFGFLATAHF